MNRFGMGTPRFDPSRRRFLIGGAAAVFLAACGKDPSPASSGASTDGFPRTIRHGLGRTVITEKPDRIVATADRDQLDVLLAMGVTPVQYGFSGDYEAAAPWIDPSLLDGIDRVRMADAFSPNLESIAAVHPDLILDAWSDETVQDSLSEIAPTIQIKTANTDSWESAQVLAGRATGKEDAAARAIRATKGTISAQAERLAGVSELVVAVAFQSGGELVMIPGTDIGGRIVAELGMNVLPPPDGASGLFSLELMPDLLGETDIILSYDFGELAGLEESAVFRNLPAVRAGGYVSVPPEAASACYQESTLSLRWAADRVADALLAASAGEGKRLR